MATLGRNMLQQNMNPLQMVQNAHMVSPRNHRVRPCATGRSAPGILARANPFRRMIAAPTAPNAGCGYGKS